MSNPVYEAAARPDLSSPQTIRREISFKSGAETIAGDLVLPVTPGPHPAILTVAGTGPQNRYGDIVLADGTIRNHGRYVHISQRLAEAGIASLYWDKRGVGQSTGEGSQPGDAPGERDAYTSVMTDVEDAENALNFLAAQPEIDSQRIAVMGRLHLNRRRAYGHRRIYDPDLRGRAGLC
jgi:dipeptidyl aminopeptidase/acylaminoacyl peptidase